MTVLLRLVPCFCRPENIAYWSIFAIRDSAEFRKSSGDRAGLSTRNASLILHDRRTFALLVQESQQHRQQQQRQRHLHQQSADDRYRQRLLHRRAGA